MKLEEAIKHAEEVAKEKQEQADSNVLMERNGTKFLYDGEEYKKCRKCAEEHKQLAEWLSELKQLREQTRWIPVSERLPNFNDIVLASAESDYDELKVIITVYSAEEFWFNGKIKAWMLLPDPYKAESEG